MTKKPTPAFSIEVGAPCAAWGRACPGAAALAEEAARQALLRAADRTVAPAACVVLGITLGEDGEQQRLNRIYRGTDAPTNILAFPAADWGRPPPAGAPLLLGDIVLAFETIAREAAEQHKNLGDHLRHLVVHGVLHLLGCDHESAAAAAAMEAREIEILAALGVPDPYRDTM